MRHPTSHQHQNLKRTQETLLLLQRSHDLYTALALISPDAAIITGVDLRIIMANMEAAKMAGFRIPEQMVGKNALRFVAEPDRGLMLENVKKVIERGSLRNIEYRLIRKDGTSFTGEVSASVVLDDDYKPKAIICVIRDVSQRKEAERVLRESEFKYKTLVQNIPGMIYRAHSDWSAEIISGSLDVCGYTENELNSMRHNWLSIVHRDDGKAVLRKGAELRTQQKTIIQVYRIIHKNGEVRWMEDHKTSRFSEKGEFIGIEGMVLDITRRKNAEQALRYSEERFRQIAENANTLIWEVDAAGLYTYVSPVIETMLGYGVEEVVGKKSFYDFFAPEDFQQLQEQALEFFKKQASFHDFLRKCIHKNGSAVWISTSAVPILDEKGALIGYRGCDDDITGYKQAEKELRESKTKLEEQTWGLERTNKACKLLSEELQVVNEELLRTNKRLRKMALIDVHTGLYNHRYFEDVIEREFYRAERENDPLAMIFIDIDYFKSINDVYGHKFGDLVLKQFADVIKKIIRRYDIAIRFGGEEFVVICPHSDRQEAMTLSLRIFDHVKSMSFGDLKHNVQLKVSVGIVAYPEDKIVKSMDFIEIADHILDKAKEDGANRIYTTCDLHPEKFHPPEADEQDKEEDVNYLRGKIAKLTKNANQSLVEAVFAFAKALKLKDNYTGEHTENTVRYATELAKAAGLSKEEVRNVRQAAILHDLGKIGISEKILQKNGKLTPEEFEEIKRHPSIAVDIIRPIHFLHRLIPYVLHHHERWDGTGYPDGLKEEHIPFGARIVAIADVYHALISDRPYRKAHTKEEALEIIRAGAGTQFDPKIVDLFLRTFTHQEERQFPQMDS